jgi:tape measure domain-containing protein
MADASLIVRIAANIDDLDREMKKSVGKIKSLSADLQSIGTSLSLGVTAPLAAFGGAAVKAFGEIDALKRGLIAVTGSSEAANKQFSELREVAKLPGLGLQEAVRGSVNLQALGFSADKAKTILLEFGNALASVGRGREDLEEVVRQLGQMASRGKVTADNLKPILERVPQAAAIIKQEFGTIDTEVLQKMGISSARLIDTLTTEFGRLSRVTGGVKNDFENLRDSVQIALADAGEAFAPFAKAFIDKVAVPLIGKISDLATAFKSLSPETQKTAVSVATATASVGLLTLALAKLLDIVAKLGALFSRVRPLLASAINPVTLAVGFLLINIDKTIESWNKLRAEWENDQFLVTITGRALSLEKEFKSLLTSLTPVAPEVKVSAKAFETLGVEVEKTSKKLSAIPFEDVSAKNRVIIEQFKLVQEEYNNLAKSIARMKLDGIEPATLALEGFLNIGIEGFSTLSEKTEDFGVILDDVLFGSLRRAQDAFEEFGDTQRKLDKIQQEMGGRQMDPRLDDTKIRTATSSLETLGRQVSLVLNDVSRDITELIFKGGKFKDVMVGALENIGKSLARLALEAQFKRLAETLGDMLLKIPKLGKVVDIIFGGGKGAAAGVSGGVGGAAGAVGGGAAGGGASAAASGISGILGTVFSGISAVSGVIGNFQFAGMNKSLDLIEHETRFSQIHLGYILEKLNQYLPFLQSNNDALWAVRASLFDPVAARLEQLVSIAVGGGGKGANVTINVSGSDPKATAEQVVKYLKQYGVVVPA